MALPPTYQVHVGCSGGLLRARWFYYACGKLLRDGWSSEQRTYAFIAHGFTHTCAHTNTLYKYIVPNLSIAGLFIIYHIELCIRRVPIGGIYCVENCSSNNAPMTYIELQSLCEQVIFDRIQTQLHSSIHYTIYMWRCMYDIPLHNYLSACSLFLGLSVVTLMHPGLTLLWQWVDTVRRPLFSPLTHKSNTEMYTLCAYVFPLLPCPHTSSTLKCTHSAPMCFQCITSTYDFDI